MASDLDALIRRPRDRRRAARIPGCADLAIDDVAGQPILQIQLERDQLARYGIPAEAVLDVVESVSGKTVGEVIEGQLRFPLAVLLPDEYRNSPQKLADLMLATPTGSRIPLSRVADVREVRGPKYISREWSKRRITIQCNVRGRDIGSFVAEAQKLIAGKVELPRGYRLEWGGQFENMRRAQVRLMIVVPLALAMIVALLYITFRNVTDTAFVFASVPFACVGGMLALWLRDMPHLDLGRGRIHHALGRVGAQQHGARLGVAPQPGDRTCRRNGDLPGIAVVLAHDDHDRPGGQRRLSADGLQHGMGAEVQRPLATVVIGGVITSTLMTLFVLPVMFASLGSARLARQSAGRDDESGEADMERTGDVTS